MINFDELVENYKQTTSEDNEVIYNIFSHIAHFIDICGTDWVGFPQEYFHRNKQAQREAIEAFSNILCELEEYIDE